MTKIRYRASGYAIVVTLVALFPRSARFLYAPGFYSRRGTAIYVAVDAALRFYIQKGMRWAREQNAKNDAEKARLREELGREPTDDEVIKRLIEREI